MPGQGQLDESLPVGAFGGRGTLHRRLSLMLWVVLRTHGPTLAGRYGQVRGNFVRMIAVDEGRSGAIVPHDVTVMESRQTDEDRSRQSDRAALRIFLSL